MGHRRRHAHDPAVPGKVTPPHTTASPQRDTVRLDSIEARWPSPGPSAPSPRQPGEEHEKHVLVTGPGRIYIGAHVVRAFLERGGIPPVVLDDLSSGHAEFVPDGGVTLIQAQVQDAGAVRKALREHDVTGVMHIIELQVRGRFGHPSAALLRAERAGHGSVLQTSAGREHSQQDRLLQLGCPSTAPRTSTSMRGLPTRPRRSPAMARAS